ENAEMLLPGDAKTTGIELLLEQAIEKIAAISPNAAHFVQNAAALLEKMKELTHHADNFALVGLFPLCLTLLLLHENTRSIQEGSSFRFPYVIGRTLVVVALLLTYGDVCRLITSVAGAGAGWLSTGQYENLSDWDKSKEVLGLAWDNSSLGEYIL